MQIENRAANRLGGHRIESGERLAGHEQPRLVNHYRDELDLLAHPLAERLDETIGAILDDRGWKGEGLELRGGRRRTLEQREREKAVGNGLDRRGGQVDPRLHGTGLAGSFDESHGRRPLLMSHSVLAPEEPERRQHGRQVQQDRHHGEPAWPLAPHERGYGHDLAQ